jgi:hypothetical protein
MIETKVTVKVLLSSVVLLTLLLSGERKAVAGSSCNYTNIPGGLRECDWVGQGTLGENCPTYRNREVAIDYTSISEAKSYLNGLNDNPNYTDVINLYYFKPIFYSLVSRLEQLQIVA